MIMGKFEEVEGFGALERVEQTMVLAYGKPLGKMGWIFSRGQVFLFVMDVQSSFIMTLGMVKDL